MRKDIVYYYSWLDKKFRTKSDQRWNTFKTAMNLYVQNGFKTIVETGCARLPDDWGGGQSTLLLGEFCKYLGDGSKLWTVDLNPTNMQACKIITGECADFIDYNIGDSVAFLKSWTGPKIDFLYLDSYDYPYGHLLNAYGGAQDIAAAEKILNDMTEDQVVAKFADVIAGSQNHCVEELHAALPHLHDRSIILIDDNNLAGGGKPRLAKNELVSLGYTCLADWQQSLWIKW